MSVRDLKSLGESLRDRRGELGLTQEEFAKRAEISLKTYQRVERGEITPRVKTLGALDRAARWVPGGARGLLEDGRTPTLIDDVAVGIFERIPRDEAERAILALKELSEDSQWAAIVNYRRNLAESARQDPLGRMGKSG
jgi:transcriptional regulator with XRE-family HTH domain